MANLYPEPTQWQNDTGPDINAENLNKIEQGIAQVAAQSSDSEDRVAQLNMDISKWGLHQLSKVFFSYDQIDGVNTIVMRFMMQENNEFWFSLRADGKMIFQYYGGGSNLVTLWEK